MAKYYWDTILGQIKSSIVMEILKPVYKKKNLRLKHLRLRRHEIMKTKRSKLAFFLATSDSELEKVKFKWRKELHSVVDIWLLWKAVVGSHSFQNKSINTTNNSKRLQTLDNYICS